ncbi:phosphoribosyltransferase [Natronoarchaeum rubrum]|uniref:phosphoribosyltransferase n=1 Tax=Natronoarchaeum rubrum TaxID=755311 RepID=UPI002111F3BE|nr:phosphoribosyltransferase family protein [Natronoarchaeum rubrum]
MFENRGEAGERLADLLVERSVRADLVLGIPRGALPVARPVADRLDAELDVVVAKKMGAPHNEELAIGAVASDGSVWRNEELIDRVGVDDAYVESERERTAASAREKLRTYRGVAKTPDVRDRAVVVVDDGVATGATARACLRQVRDRGAERVVLAVPVGSPNSLAALRSFADEVHAIEAPAGFRAVGQYYRDFGQVSDAEARDYLDR